MTAGEGRAMSAFLAGGSLSNGACREMMDALPVAIYTTDAKGRLTYFNSAAAELAGRSPQLGADQWCVTWKLFLPDGTPMPHDQCPMAAVLKGGAPPLGMECIAERPDGSRFWFSAYPAAVRDHEGRITGGVNLLLDITRRKASEKEANEQFGVIVETTSECVMMVAPDGTLLFMNSPGLEMVGAPNAGAVAGRSIYPLIAPEDRDRFRVFNEAICRGEKAGFEFNMVGLKGIRRLETHAAPFRYADGTVVDLAISRDITERARSERAVLWLGAIVDSSDDAIISKDLNGVITSWNQSAQRLFGYTAEEAVGQPVTILIPPDRQDEEPNILARLRRGERVDHFETIRRRKDGILLDISLTISPIRDSRGTIIGASKIARDISERRRAEKAIETLNAKLTQDLSAMALLQRLSIRMVESDDFAELLDEILGAAMDITGAKMGNIQLLEDGLLKIVAHRGFEAQFLAEFENVRSGESVCGTALERGARVTVDDVGSSAVFAERSRAALLAAGIRSVQSTPLVTRHGEILGMLSTHYQAPQKRDDRSLHLLDILARQTADLIERRRAEAALQESESRFRQLANAMPQIVWTARSDGYLDYYNERWYQFTGFDRSVFGDGSWQPILHPDDLPRCREGWYKAVDSGSPFNLELRFWDRFERRWRWFVGRALPARDTSGNIVKWFGSCTDIDEQKTVEEDLRRANQDLEQFAYSASHDLQEPLRSVKIYSELLAESYGKGLSGQSLQFLTYLRNGATRMEMLVRDLLAYTQISKFDKPVEATDAGEALSGALSNLAGAIAQTGAQITAGDLPSLQVHNAHLQQLFQNLIGNAIKYRSPDRPPVINVTAERQSGNWAFAVQDNGIGIHPDYKERIFGLFKRLHTSDEYSGTGIGLAICQRIVDRYRGRIWVDSEPGRGSTFRFTLPV